MGAKGILIPEIIIYDTLNSVFSIIKSDFDSKIDKTETMLYRYFKEDDFNQNIEFETFNYYDQAVDLFTVKDPIQINLGYNMETSNQACIHILLPNESGRPFALGGDENYQDPIITTDNGVDSSNPKYTNTFDSVYQLMITSENTLEVLIIYAFLKGALTSLHAHLDLYGLRDPKFGGQDVNIQADLVPTHIFHRSFTLSFFHEITVPDIFSKELIRNFAATGINRTN